MLQSRLLQRLNRILQLPYPAANPPLHLLRNPLLPTPTPRRHPAIILQQPIQLLPRSSPIVFRIRTILLRLLARNLEFVFRRAV